MKAWSQGPCHCPAGGQSLLFCPRRVTCMKSKNPGTLCLDYKILSKVLAYRLREAMRLWLKYLCVFFFIGDESIVKRNRNDAIEKIECKIQKWKWLLPLCRTEVELLSTITWWPLCCGTSLLSWRKGYWLKFKQEF